MWHLTFLGNITVSLTSQLPPAGSLNNYYVVSLYESSYNFLFNKRFDITGIKNPNDAAITIKAENTMKIASGYKRPPVI